MSGEAEAIRALSDGARRALAHSDLALMEGDYETASLEAAAALGGVQLIVEKIREIMR